MKTIPLVKGKETIVDDEYYHYLNQFIWTTNKKGYVVTSKNKKLKSSILHRNIINCPKNKEIDHINHNKLDNRKSNLRVVTSSQNKMNMHKRFPGTSKFKGVHWKKTINKWVAQIRFNGKKIHLGVFIKEEDAALAYNKAALTYYEKYAILNKV